MPFKARQFYYRCSKNQKTQPKRDWSDYNKKMKMRIGCSILNKMICITLVEIRSKF